ncbi:MAG: DJ-1/PfpI family protein [Mycobacterium sp.]
MTQIAIVLYPGFTALDFIGPYEVLRNLPDTEVRFVWHQTGPVAADSGVLMVGATHTFEETPTPDVLLIPGGMTTIEHARDKNLLGWVQSVHRHTLWTTSVCSGSVILAAAGVLDGKRATSHWAMLPALKTFGVQAVGDQRIVSEGKVLTAAGVSAGIDLGLWLASRLADESTAKAIQLVIEYDPQPPFDSGHFSKASTATKAAAAMVLGRELPLPQTLKASTLLLWEQAIARLKGAPSRARRWGT